jgi:type I thyroxine 5'-deiodinase
VSRAYLATPDRLYVVDRDGRIAYRGGPGPFGFNPREMEQTLVLMLLEQEKTSR